MLGVISLLSILSQTLSVGATTKEYPLHTDLQWTNATLQFLKKAYTAPDYSALVLNAGMMPPGETLLAPASEKEALCSSIHAQHIFEEPIPSSAYHLPVDIASSPTASQALTRITDLLVAFNESNRIFVLIGDSMARNSLLALECIINIENGYDKVNVEPPLLLAQKIGFGANYYEFSFPNPVTNEPVTFRLFYMALWERFRPGNMGWYDSELSLKVFSPKHADDVQALFAFNIGLHEQANQYYKNLHAMFTYAKNKLLTTMGKNPTKNKFLYRETTAQHFNRSAGYYDHHAIKKWKSKNVKRSYQCVPSASTDSAEHDWRHHAESKALEANPHVQFVPFYAVSRHYHDMHPFAFKRSRLKRKNIDIDCTHFEPMASVILHRILWQSLLIY